MAELREGQPEAKESFRTDEARDFREAGRVFFLEGWVQGELRDVRQEIRELRQEIKATENALRQEISSLHQELKATGSALRQEMIALRQEVKQELSGVRALVWTTTGLVIAAMGIVVSVLMFFRH
jgi:predicted PurR-regulated permease PerM